MISGTTMQSSPEVVVGRLRMLRDKLLIRPLDFEPSKIVATVRHGRPVRGVVVEVGPGTYPNRYSKDRSKTWKSKVFVPTQVKPGDVVELGGLNIYDGSGYLFPEVIVGGIKHLIIQEADVVGVIG